MDTYDWKISLLQIPCIWLTCHCASGFQRRKDTFAFMKSAWRNSYLLCQKVLNHTFRAQYYPQKEIVERGKKRLIKPPTFECKVVQKVLCDYIIRPILEPVMIQNTYAGIRGRGTSKMYENLLYQLNRYGKKGNVIVMTDFANYFASIPNARLEEELRKYIKDQRILDVFRLFCPEDIGLSLGNESSQLPASFYPSMIDHKMKDQLGCKCYQRYSDDILFLAEDETSAMEILKIIQINSGKLGLRIKEEKIQVIPYGKDFIFCKERYLWNGNMYYRIMNPAIARNEVRKLHSFHFKYHQQKKEQYQSVIGCIRSHPNTYHTVQRLETHFRKGEHL